MPVEVIYTVPSLMGIALNYNLTSVVLPYTRSALKLELNPDPFTPMAMLQSKKLETIKVSGIHQIK